MIMGHIGFGGLFDKWIHIFHMPMFFLISGYFYKKQDIQKTIAKRAKTVLLPYLFFGVLACILHSIEINEIDVNALYHLFWENTGGDGIPLAGALWFLTAMFVADLLYSFLDNINNNDKALTVKVIIIAILGMAVATYLPIRLPYAIDVGMVGVGFIHIGRLLKKRWKQVFEVKLIWCLLGVVAFSLLGFINDYVNLRNGRYGIWILFWINAAGLSVSLWNICKTVFEWYTVRQILTRAILRVENIGRDSIIFLCLNQLVIHYFGDLMWYFLPTATTPLFLLGIRAIVTLIGTMIILLLAQLIFTRTKLKILIGRF